jgi:hypothetical protein
LIVRIGRYLPAIACMLVIFILSSRSGEQLNTWLPLFQSWIPGLSDFNPMHYVAYFMLGLTVAFALGKRAGTWLGCALNVVICVAYGLSDEWHQSFVPMRSPDILDLKHDAIGAAAAAILVLLIMALQSRRGSRNYT